MSNYLRTRNSALLFKIETTEGVDASPSASTDGVLVESPKITPSTNNIKTNEVTGSLDGNGSIVGGMKVQLTFDVYLKGSGAAGTAPEYGDLLKSCGWAETITATAVPSSAEACAAGGSTTEAILGTSASGTAETYRGMPIELTGAVAGESFISDYATGKAATLTDTMGGAIIATSEYQIPANVLYAPNSASIPSGTIYLYIDGLLYKVTGARGTFKLSLGAGGGGKLSFTMSGMYSGKIDSALPAVTYDATRPAVFKNGVMLINHSIAAVQTLSLDTGNTITNPDNPNALEGFDAAIITARNITGSVDPAETLVATRDIMSDFRSGTKRSIHARFGISAGNKVGITIPQALYTGQTPNDNSGLATVDVPFDAVGQDSGAFICLY